MKRILIVDDEQDHRLILRTMLEASGYICEEAEDGMTALEMLSKVPVDLVVTDLNMPRMNGLELIEMLAEHPRYQALSIILVTSQDVDVTPTLRLRGNLLAIHQKPYQWNRLFESVAAATKNSELVTSLAG